MANKAEMLMDVLEYIEVHIASAITVDDIAKDCYVSVSSLQKTFKYVFHLTVKDYILRRRFTCAARDLLETDESILDIALKYGYQNHESFTRGFQKVWNVSPSEYRRNRRFAGHTPKLSIINYYGSEENAMSRGMKFDLTELYDVLRDRKDMYYVCADIKHLKWINDNLGIKAGDAVILETMRRIDEACEKDDVLIRTGGDEFVVFTNSSESAHAEEIVKKVGENHGSINVDGTEISVEVYVGAFKGFPERVNAESVFRELAEKYMIIHKD